MISRRNFPGSLFAAETKRYKIRDIQTLTLTGPRTYLLTNVTAGNGSYGIGEA